MSGKRLGWFGIIRLGLVQTALGAIVVLTTSTLNRVMVVELALPATLPGVLVGLHYAVQVLRPRLGYGSDVGGRRTPWIVGGMLALSLGAATASLAVALMSVQPLLGIALAVLAFTVIGGGVGAAGTSLLVLLAKQVDPERRGPAATIVWMMMIAGFVVTATVAGHLLDPFSLTRLVAVSLGVAAAAFVLALIAVFGIEGRAAPEPQQSPQTPQSPQAMPPFREAIRQVWGESRARRFAVFVFVSMLAYSGQDLILEPFAGTVFGLTPGESTRLSGVQHAGVFLGMLLVALACGRLARGRLGSLLGWTVGGCIASGAVLLTLAFSGFVVGSWPLRATVFTLGVANGAFAVAAIGSMMSLVNDGRAKREGVRMGLWGAAQAIAFGLGGLLGTLAVDLLRWALAAPTSAYAMVFAGEAMLFFLAAGLALRVRGVRGGAAGGRAHAQGSGYAPVGGD
ncbi:BCD family MFS transporter [Pelagibius sp.]|uniref:BCD family MFS transporter n=1 Tax=Pelagibius sp. TaxID=1931238 RepID=UPI00261D2385|nr:BCD family MFS transporter [Pelagibius sp.]